MATAVLIRATPITEAMIVSNSAVESYSLLVVRGSAPPESQRIWTIYEEGSIWRSANTFRLYESIVPTYDRISCTFTNLSPITFTSTGHGLANGQVLTSLGARDDGTSVCPEDLDIGCPFWVVNATANTFQLALSKDVDASLVGVDLGAAGSGVLYFRKGDTGSQYWNNASLPGDNDYETQLDATITDLGDDTIVTPRWLDIGPDNKHAMFDARNTSATTAADELVVVLQPGRCDSVGLQGLVGYSLQVVMNDGVSDVYDNTILLNEGAGASSWHSWFFGGRSLRDTVLLTDLPLGPIDPTITVTVSGPGQTVEIATLVVGTKFEIGATQRGMTLGLVDYSTKEADEFGEFSFVERSSANKADAVAFLANGRVDIVHRVLRAYRATPTFWGLASDHFDASAFLGFYREFNIEIAYPTHSLVSIQLEGMT